jgi:monothiol glutaredoxin
MKGNPEQPMCGFSRGVVKILSAFDIPPEKFKTYNVLEDQELRTGIKEFS